MSRQFELLEKSASWAEVGGVGVGASQLLNDESAKVKTIRTLPAVGAPAERVLCRMSLLFLLFLKAVVYSPAPPSLSAQDLLRGKSAHLLPPAPPFPGRG